MKQSKNFIKQLAVEADYISGLKIPGARYSYNSHVTYMGGDLRLAQGRIISIGPISGNPKYIILKDNGIAEGVKESNIRSLTKLDISKFSK